MNDLHAMAIRAVAEAGPDRTGSAKIRAIKILRNMDSGQRRYLRDYLEAVEWAMARPRTTLTLADKERAVTELVDRLSTVSENRAYADAYPQHFKPGSVNYFARRQDLLEKAILRVAMARTVD